MGLFKLFKIEFVSGLLLRERIVSSRIFLCGCLGQNCDLILLDIGDILVCYLIKKQPNPFLPSWFLVFCSLVSVIGSFTDG